MESYRLKILVFIFSITIIVMSGTEITIHDNLPIDGDSFIKTRVTFVKPGDSGKSEIWDFSQAQVLDENLRVRYSIIDDSLINVTEQGTRYDYRLRGDSLLWRGYENRATFMRDSISAIEMVYPMSYGIKSTRAYCFIGEYSRTMAVQIKGTSTVYCDGEGIIYLPNGDTISNVIRVCHICKSNINMMRKEDDTTHIMNSSDTTMQRIEERYSWYANGYRYPIAETLINTDLICGKEKIKQGASFICYPSEQIQNRNRPENENLAIGNQIKNYSVIESNISSNSSAIESLNNYNRDLIESIDRNNEINSDIKTTYYNNSLKIFLPFQAINDGEIEYILSDLIGRVYASGKTNSQEIEISEIPKCNYILLINRNGEKNVKKILLEK